MLTVLGGWAEFERDLIHARTSEGRARAVANGVRLGRKPTLKLLLEIGHLGRPTTVSSIATSSIDSPLLSATEGVL
jgi:DNA invertase Pin-like site-specific DNA recombinase